MFRRAGPLALILLICGGLLPSPARAARPPRIVVLTVDGTDIRDWSLSAVFGHEGVGLLATRTDAPSNDAASLRASAYASFGAGAPLDLRAGARPVGRHGGAIAGLLGEALKRNGMLAAAVGDASGDDLEDAPAGLAVMRLDGTAAGIERVGTTTLGPIDGLDARRAALSASRADSNAPGGRRTDVQALEARVSFALGWARLVVIDFGDTERADRAFANDQVARYQAVTRALSYAGRVAKDVRSMLDPGDTFVVASLVPPLRQERAGVHLGAVSFSGPPSLPISGTTRQRGVIAISDLAPTLLRRVGVEPPAEMEGRTVRFLPAATPGVTALRRYSELELALRSRRPLTRGWLIASAALSLAAFMTIAAGRGRAGGRERLPRRWRDFLGLGLLAGAAAPAAMLLAPVIAQRSVAGIAGWTIGLSVGSALLARTALGHERALAVIALADIALFAGDLAAGSPLAARSAIGFQIAGGGRFYGIDEGMLGVMLAAPLVAAGVAFDRLHDRRRMLVAATLGLAFVASLAGAPAFGSKFGAPFTLVPAFGVFLLLAAGRRVDKPGVIGIAIATTLLSASLAAADALASPEASSHIGREISGRTSASALVIRKLTSLVKITATTVWLPVAIVIAGTAVVLILRRRDLFGRAIWGKPARRAALWAVAVGSVLAMASNDTGIITVAAAGPIVAACFYGPFLSSEQSE